MINLASEFGSIALGSVIIVAFGFVSTALGSMNRNPGLGSTALGSRITLGLTSASSAFASAAGDSSSAQRKFSFESYS